MNNHVKIVATAQINRANSEAVNDENCTRVTATAAAAAKKNSKTKNQLRSNRIISMYFQLNSQFTFFVES